MKPRLLVVDDDEDIRSQMRWALCKDYDILLAEDRPSALEAFDAQQPAAVLLDLGLPPHPGDPQEGLATLVDLLAHDRLVKVIVITGQSDKEHARKAVGEGAYDFLCKPVDMEELKIILKRAYYVANLEREYRDMQRQFNEDSFEGMLGTGPAMQTVFSLIRRFATSDYAVAFLGESGTGKEMAAQALHRCSRRKAGPFVAINCGAIPENLLESELFGHEKGAFTGAHAQRQGRIEMANGGTLFLDEIGELPLSLQVKLLRFLQEKRLDRLGGRKEIEIDVRVVSATNSDLTAAMKEGRFREDLYYRLAELVVTLPPLRERGSDLLLLAKAFLKKYASENGRPAVRFTQEGLRAIEQHRWPGNVRELGNRIKRAVIMADGGRVTPKDLELAEDDVTPRWQNLKEAREALERDLIEKALLRHNGKISPAATELGISRPTLYELMDKLGMKRVAVET